MSGPHGAVLLVDDEEKILKRLGRALRDQGHDVVEAGSAREAQRQLAQRPFDLLVFDNGSAVLGANPSYCVDPADRLGPTVNRALTRVTEYALDETAMTATLVRSWSHGSRFAYFAGSARRLPGGNTLVDWAADKQALVSEVDPDGTIVWELKAPTALSYRAEKAEVPDRTDPVVTVSLRLRCWLRGRVSMSCSPTTVCNTTVCAGMSRSASSMARAASAIAGSCLRARYASHCPGSRLLITASVTVDWRTPTRCRCTCASTARCGSTMESRSRWMPSRTGARMPLRASAIRAASSTACVLVASM